MNFIVFFGKSFDNTIKKIPKAYNEQDEVILDLLQSHMGDCPNIAWYPSAGLNFRDLIEVN